MDSLTIFIIFMVLLVLLAVEDIVDSKMGLRKEHKLLKAEVEALRKERTDLLKWKDLLDYPTFEDAIRDLEMQSVSFCTHKRDFLREYEYQIGNAAGSDWDSCKEDLAEYMKRVVAEREALRTELNAAHTDHQETIAIWRNCQKRTMQYIDLLWKLRDHLAPELSDDEDPETIVETILTKVKP